VVRGLWLVLPVTLGPALSAAVDGWADAPAVLAEVMAWAAWAVGLVAVLRPHPVTLTVVRTGAALAVGVAIACAPPSDAPEAALALAATAALLGAAIQPAFGQHCIDAVSYGDERRFPLRMPPLLLAGPLPLAVAVVGAGIAAGPLLLADRRWALGGALTVVGLAAAALAARSLHSLTQRFVVLVPNGLVVHDPLTMADPVLFTRADVASLARPLVPSAPAGDGEVDLRVGASSGSVVLELREPVRIVRAGRTGGTVVETDRLLLAPSRPGVLFETAAARRITVR
jgi:hypothetical protein